MGGGFGRFSFIPENRDNVMTRFKPRQRVWIINCTLGGRFLVEGRSWVVRHLGEDRYLVRFPDGELIERFVDPKAQADPYAYVRTLENKEAA